MFSDTTLFFPQNLKPADLKHIAKQWLWTETWKKIQECFLHKRLVKQKSFIDEKRTQSKANNVISSSQYCKQVYL